MSRRDPTAARDRKQTYTGRYLTISQPSERDVDLLDAAMALPLVNRFDGSTTVDPGWSVANHHRLAGMIARVMITDPEHRDQKMIAVADALLHDVHEYVIGDITTPTKAGIDERHENTAEAIDDLKSAWDVAIYDGLRMPWMPPKLRRDKSFEFMKRVDFEAYTVESKLFMRNGWDGEPWKPFWGLCHQWCRMTRREQAYAWLTDLRMALAETHMSDTLMTQEIITDTIVRMNES